MTLSNFPYLTIELLESGESQALQFLPSIFPPAAPWVPIIQRALPLIHTIPAEREILQGALDRVNRLLGKTAPAV